MWFPLLTTLAFAAPTVPTASPTEEFTLPDGRTVRFETAAGADGAQVRHGDFRVVDDEGDWLIRGEYEDGVREGSWFYRHPSGDKLASGKYRDGERHGRWKFYWLTGEPCAEGVFKGGVLQGDWEFYDLGGESKSGRRLAIQRVEGRSEATGLRYVGHVGGGNPVGAWDVRWEDGSHFFAGSFDLQGEIRAAAFRHVGGIEDGAFFTELRDVPHPLDWVFMDPDEYGALRLKGELPARDPASIQGAVESLALQPLLREVEALALPEMGAARKMKEPKPGVHVQPLGLAPVGARKAEVFSALKALAAVEWDNSQALFPALRIVEERLEPGLGFPRLGFGFARKDTTTTTTTTADARRMAVLRAYSLLILREGDRDFWSIDARLGNVAPVDDFLPLLTGGVDMTLVLTPEDGAELLRQRAEASKGGARARGERSRSNGASEPRDEAVQAGLEWLLSCQAPDGRWVAGRQELDAGTDLGRHKESYGHDAGVTALAVLALTRDPGTANSEARLGAVRRGLAYLLSERRRQDGVIATTFEAEGRGGRPFMTFNQIWTYDHAAALQAMVEASALVSTPRVRLGIKDAISVLERARNPYGTWRYGVLPNGENDTSVTFWVMRALLQAERAGWRVREDHGNNVLDYLSEMTDPATGRVGYIESGTISARVVGLNQHIRADFGETLTAEALALREWLDWGDEARTEQAIELILRQLPSWESENDLVDYGYWLAGTEALMAVGGKAQERWSSAVEGALLALQVARGRGAGSWKPIGVWCGVGGRVYATATAVLTLQTL